MFPPSSLVSLSPRWARWSDDLPLRASFSPTHPLTRRDVPVAQVRGFLFSIPLFRGVAKAALYCAHRTSIIDLIYPSNLACSRSGMGADGSSTARVQRGPSEAARCASTEDHQAPSSPFYRARSASKKGTWPLLPHPSKLARYRFKRVAWIGPQLRTSNDHRFIVGVPLARGTNQATLYFHPSPPVPPPNPPKFPPKPPWPVPQYSPF